MPEIEIRPAIATDIPTLISLEHGYSSDHVWQMDYKDEGGTIKVTFREVRLPRSVQVRYPQNPQSLADNWSARDGLLVALIDGEPVGYISLAQNPQLKATRITDLAITRRLRRQKIGSALVLAAQDWASKHNSRRLILELQPKNHPAIQMAKKLGFELCGYNDHYFANHDIALFFSKWLK
ncbi:MAG: GNAT family N-acetyltransferase [Chloroflexi bacterium]|nr:GNAT family N-acetyltransferase [Chloroflexota bacterium]